MERTRGVGRAPGGVDGQAGWGWAALRRSILGRAVVPLALALSLVACASSSPSGDAPWDASQDASKPADTSVLGDLTSPQDLGDAASTDVLAENDVSDDIPSAWQPPLLAPTVALWDLSARPVEAPFPYDYYLVSDTTSPTGHRVHVDDDTRSNSVIDSFLTGMPDYYDALNEMEGFGAYTYLSVPLSGPLPEGWEQAPTDDLPSDAPVKMLRWRDDGSLDPVPFTARYIAARPRSAPTMHFIDLLPFRPLPDGAHLVVVVTAALRDADGEPIGPDAQLQCVAGLYPMPLNAEARAPLEAESERLDPLFVALDAAGIAREEIAVAFDVTVGPIRRDLLDIADQFRERASLREVGFTFDPDSDGVDDIFHPGDPGFPSGLDGVAVFARGRFQRRDYRDPDYLGGTFRPDADGRPRLDHEEPVSFYLALPDDPAGQPFPVAILLHGIDNNKDGVRSMVSPLVAQGLAVIAIDLPRHGDDGAGGVEFLSLEKPLAGRDNFRQAGVDILTTRYLLERWADPTCCDGGLDLLPPGGDGEPDIAVDRVVLLGHSLGAMCGTIGASIDQRPEAIVGLQGGGGLFYFIHYFLDNHGLSSLFPGDVLHAIEILGGQAYGPGDPVSYASMVRPDLAPYVERPHQIMLVEVIEDDTMPEACMEANARAMRLPLVGPVLKPIAGIQPSVEAHPSAGLVQYDDGATHQLGFGGPHRAAVRAQAMHFLKTFLDTGVGEIIHPWEE